MRPTPKLIVVLSRLLLGVAGLATLLALFVVVENWRGDRAWVAEVSELKARGESLDFSTLLPTPTPDDQNFFKAPKLARILYERPGDSEKTGLVAEYRIAECAEVVSAIGRPKDLAALRDRLKNAHTLTAAYSESPAIDILNAMQPMQPLIDELREAARRRPRATLDCGSVSFQSPILAANVVFRLGQALGGRAAIELELDRVDDAYADIVVLQRIANGLAQHPIHLMSQLVGVALHGIAASVIADGCKRHAWTDSRLAEFQNRLGELHPLNGFRESLWLERAQMAFVMDGQPANATKSLSWLRWFPRGWLQQNKVVYCQRFDAEVLSTFGTSPERIFPEQIAAEKKAVEATSKFPTPYGLIARLAISNVSGILPNLGTAADRFTLASVSWAAERYQLANGRYPATLNELIPQFLSALPNGIFDAQPPRYTTLPSGGHQIYFLGPNTRDDGGKDDDIAIKLPDAT